MYESDLIGEAFYLRKTTYTGISILPTPLIYRFLMVLKKYINFGNLLNFLQFLTLDQQKHVPRYGSSGIQSHTLCGLCRSYTLVIAHDTNWSYPFPPTIHQKEMMYLKLLDYLLVVLKVIKAS